MKDKCIPKSGFDFLKKLKRNNNREWFLKNKSQFEENIKLPLQQVIIELQKSLENETDGILFDTKKSIFRINRDVRFGNSKDPYKTNVGAIFVTNYKNKNEIPGLYLHIEPGNCFIGGGLYMPTSDQIRKIREFINRNPKVFKKIITHPKVIKYFGGMHGEKLKTSPRGIPEDHPNIELLRWKQFVYIKHFEDIDFQKGNLAKKIHKDFLAMMPLIHWLNDAIAIW
jgi:uncharacterized protein (TIGR02453 family)